jgi:hypothetical protein
MPTPFRLLRTTLGVAIQRSGLFGAPGGAIRRPIWQSQSHKQCGQSVRFLSGIVAAVFTSVLVAPSADALDPNAHVSQYSHSEWLVQDGHFDGAPYIPDPGRCSERTLCQVASANTGRLVGTQISGQQIHSPSCAFEKECAVLWRSPSHSRTSAVDSRTRSK